MICECCGVEEAKFSILSAGEADDFFVPNQIARTLPKGPKI
jgi:hypothetical protein